MPESCIYLRLHHIHSFIFQSRLDAQSCLYGPSLNLSFSFSNSITEISRLEANTSGGDCWWCCWRIASICFHTSSSLVAPKTKSQEKSSLTLWSIKWGESGGCVSHSRFRISQRILLTKFWYLDLSTPTQQEGQTLWNSIRHTSDSTAISPFQNKASRTPTHLGLSTADRKGKRNDNLSGATSGPSLVSSTTRNMSDVVLLNTTNLASVISPASDLSSRVSISSPPAYEAILAHRRSESGFQ